MRRKSDRNKSKSSPEKKLEKPKRGRTSRRRRRSASSSPDPDSPSDEVTRDSSAAVPVEVDNKEMHSKEISPDADEDQVWHVKSAGGSSDTGEIQKLTICLSRPPSISDHSDKSPRARKKLDRSSSQTDSPSESPDDSKKNRIKTKRNSTKDVSDKEDCQRSEEINEESVTSSQEVCNINITDVVGVPMPPDVQVLSVEESENNLKNQVSSADNLENPDASQIDKECDSDKVQGDDNGQSDINMQDSNEKSPVRKIMDNNIEIDLKDIELPTSTVCITSNNADIASTSESDSNKNTLCDTNEANAVDSTSKHEQIKASTTPEHVNHVQDGSHTPEQERSHTPDLKDKQPEMLKVARQTSECSNVGQKKRRWGKTSKVTKTTIVSISTDSLKNIISDVQPVGLDDCLLEDSSKPPKEIKHAREPKNHKKEEKLSRKIINKVSAESTKSMSHRKISITTNNEVPIIQRPPSPPQNTSSSVLFISNLVRPFTLAQLRNLLQRTGKIVENGFWIDKIKSKCYVEYENEDQAVETRHALHGVTWPVSNPKTLNVDFSSCEALKNAASSEDASATIKGNSTGPAETWIKEQHTDTNNISAIKDVFEKPWDKRRTTVREWDLGKGEIIDERIERDIEKPDRNIDRRKRRSAERSPEPAKKFKKKEDEAPAKLLDDLFRKTKITPCIYWLPLTTEMIKVKEEQRRLHMAEHERRMAELRRSRATAHQHPPHHRR